MFKDCITICTESENVDVPIMSKPPKPDIQITGDLDFGIVPHDGIGRKELYLTNHGEKGGEFQVGMYVRVEVKYPRRSKLCEGVPRSSIILFLL